MQGAVSKRQPLLLFLQLLAKSRSGTPADVVSTQLLIQTQCFELWVLFSQIVLRIVADQLARIRNIEALKAIIAQAVQNGEFHILDIDAAVDKLIQIALRHEGIEHGDAAFFTRR